jgi:hypothetical protein
MTASFSFFLELLVQLEIEHSVHLPFIIGQRFQDASFFKLKSHFFQRLFFNKLILDNRANQHPKSLSQTLRVVVYVPTET